MPDMTRLRSICSWQLSPWTTRFAWKKRSFDLWSQPNCSLVRPGPCEPSLCSRIFPSFSPVFLTTTKMTKTMMKLKVQWMPMLPSFAHCQIPHLLRRFCGRAFQSWWVGREPALHWSAASTCCCVFDSWSWVRQPLRRSWASWKRIREWSDTWPFLCSCYGSPGKEEQSFRNP